jgi:hypothetical protein
MADLRSDPFGTGQRFFAASDRGALLRHADCMA